MADAPERADHGRVFDAPLAADDGGDGNDVIWVSGMAHPEKKTERDDGEEGEHWLIRRLRQSESGSAGFREIPEIRSCLHRFLRKLSESACPAARLEYSRWRLLH